MMIATLRAVVPLPTQPTSQLVFFDKIYHFVVRNAIWCEFIQILVKTSKLNQLSLLQG